MSPCEQLNRNEVEIATQVWHGLTNPEIAALLGTAEQTVKNNLRSIFDKLGVWSRLELALYVASHGGERWAEYMSGKVPAEHTVLNAAFGVQR